MKHIPGSVIQAAYHGSNTLAVRPQAKSVYWYGTVEPANALPGDLKSINGTFSVVPAADVGSPLVWWDFRQYDNTGYLAPRIGNVALKVLGRPTIVFGSHVELGASGKYARCDDSDIWDPSPTLTVMVITKTDGYTAGSQRRYYVNHRVSAATNVPGWSLQRSASSPYRMELVVRDGTVDQTLDVADTPASSTFLGRGAVIDPAGTFHLWGNGTTSNAASTVTGSVANAGSLTVGYALDGSASALPSTHQTKFRGVLIYASSLSDEQIASYATAAGAGTA